MNCECRKVMDGYKKCELCKLKEENKKLRECVEFYANDGHWTSNSGKVGCGIGLLIHDTDYENVPNDRSRYRFAGGKRARQCLAETSSDKG